MKKPFIVCHMMASIDGRIDCDMTEQIGSDGYYEALSSFNCPVTVEGKLTAVKHYAEKAPFQPKDNTPVGETTWYKSHEGNKWAIVCDTHGTLQWRENETPNRLCLVSEDASKEYLNYLKERKISYIATGKGHIDLKKAVEILASEFGAERIAVVGGGHINAGFLKAGLLDEVSVVFGAAIDGREGFASVFDGIETDHIHPFKLKLKDVKRMTDDSVWLTYDC
jgi:riboflavin biosynthesis pyrimidine reductase